MSTPRGSDGPELDPETKARIRAEEEERARVRTELEAQTTNTQAKAFLNPAAATAHLGAEHRTSGSSLGCFAWGTIFLVGLGIFFSIMGGNSSSTSSTPEAMSYVTFHRTCTELVSKNLKAPATAVYPDSFEEQQNGDLTGTGETGFNWNGHVDAQNGFGANIRTFFVCTSDPATFTVRLKSFDGQ